MDINKMEAAYERIADGIKTEFAKITREFNITGLDLIFLDNIKYRRKFNKDLPVDVFDLRVKIVDDSGSAKIETAELAVMTEKIEEYIKHNEGLSIKLQKKFRFVLRFEVGHYLYFREFEEGNAAYKDFEDAMVQYEEDIGKFNELVSVSDFTTRERITKYYEIDFNAWSANKVGLAAETLIEFDNNIVIP
ncbi:MAG: hypothetical protein LBC86_10915 [Oscillospiraceae bacterium]|jgi:hypothetical protein|nr:hypothetical protein [Oscillospiraceae bacterium]